MSQMPPSHTSANNMLNTCAQAIHQMRLHVLHCGDLRIHGKDILLELVQLENPLADANGARLLVRDVLGDLAMHKSWLLVAKVKEAFEDAGRKIFDDVAKEMVARVNTFQYQKSFDRCCRKAVRVSNHFESA